MKRGPQQLVAVGRVPHDEGCWHEECIGHRDEVQGLHDHEDQLVRVIVQMVAQRCDRGGGGGGGGANGDAVVGGRAVVGQSLGPRERERGFASAEDISRLRPQNMVCTKGAFWCTSQRACQTLDCCWIVLHLHPPCTKVCFATSSTNAPRGVSLSVFIVIWSSSQPPLSSFKNTFFCFFWSGMPVFLVLHVSV